MNRQVLKLLIIIFLFGLTTCKKPTEEITASLTVNPTTKEIDANTGSFNIAVTSNLYWSASCNKNWITLAPMSGSGNGTVKADFLANASSTSRTANIIFKGTNVEDRIVVVTQSGILPVLTVTPSNISVAAVASSTTINIVSNLSWSAVSNQTWCSLAQSSGIGNADLTVNIQANTVQSQRTAIITFSANGITNQTVQITQSEFIPALTVTPQNQIVNSVQGTTSYMITSNIAWNATCGQNWCTVVNPSGAYNGTLIVNFETNTSQNNRVAIIIVSGNGIPNQSVTLTQTNIIPSFTITPQNQDVTSSSGSTTFIIASNTAWSAQSDQGWSTITNETGIGNDTLRINYEENTTYSQRVANIIILLNNLSFDTVTVTQSALVSQTWNVKNDFSSVNNPNGEWSYGRKWSANSNDFDVFTVAAWWFGNWGHGAPYVNSDVNMWAKNNSNGLPCVRWTCPESGNYSLNSSFTGADSRGVDVMVYVTKNGEILFTDIIQANGVKVEYSISNFNLAKNDHFDFVEKWNGGGNSEYSWTNVSAIITK